MGFMNDMVYETELFVDVKIVDNELINEVEIYEPVILMENNTNKAQLTSEVIETLENITFTASVPAVMEKMTETEFTKEEGVNEKEPTISRETIHITESNLNVTLPSSETAETEIIADLNMKNIDTELTIETKLADSECPSHVPIIESEINNDKTLNKLSTSPQEKEKRKKKKKRRSIITNEDMIDIEKERENDQDQTITKPPSIEVIDNVKLCKEGDTNKLVMNAEVVDVKDHETNDGVKADITSDIIHDETKSSLQTLETITNLDSDVEIIHAELTQEMRAIDRECTNNVPVIESEIVTDDTSQNNLSASLPENEAKMKRKKRKSIKSNEEQVDIDKARENNKNQTITTNISATEPTSMDVIDHKEVTQKESSSKSVINTENVNSKYTDIFEMVVADISLDVTHDTIKSSIETAMTV